MTRKGYIVNQIILLFNLFLHLLNITRSASFSPLNIKILDERLFEEPMAIHSDFRDDAEDPEEAELKYVGSHNPIKSVADGKKVNTHHSARGNLKVISIQGPADQPDKSLKPKPKAPKAKSQPTKKDPKITKCLPSL